MRHSTFAAWIVTIGTVAVVQSVVHLSIVFGADRRGTIFDLDRSNGLPDIVSTVALGLAAVGAAMNARAERNTRCRLLTALAVLVAILTLADLVHDGAHPSSTNGKLVIGAVCAAGILLGLVWLDAGRRARATLAAAFCCLAGSFLVIGLDRFDHRFERARGEHVAEYQIVAKEGLELLGWSLVALALWDEAKALRRLRRLDLARTVTGLRTRSPSTSGDDEVEARFRQARRDSDLR